MHLYLHACYILCISQELVIIALIPVPLMGGWGINSVHNVSLAIYSTLLFQCSSTNVGRNYNGPKVLFITHMEVLLVVGHFSSRSKLFPRKLTTLRVVLKRECLALKSCLKLFFMNIHEYSTKWLKYSQLSCSRYFSWKCKEDSLNRYFYAIYKLF